MASSLEGLTRRSTGGRGRTNSGTPRQFNGYGMVLGYELPYVKRGQAADPANDYMTIAVLRDTGPVQFAQDQDGVLLTHINVSLRPKDKVEEGYETLSIRDMQKGREPAVRPTEINDIVAFKDMEPVDGKPGYFTARRVDAAVRKFNAELNMPYSGLVSVRREGWNEGEGGKKSYYQNRVAAMTDYALTIEGVDDLRERGRQSLQVAESMHGASPQLIVRAIEWNDAGEFEYAISRDFGLWNRDERRTMSLEEAIERFISGEDGKEGPAILAEIEKAMQKDPDTRNILFEVIPQFQFTTGGASLPSSKRAEAVKNKRPSPPDWKIDDAHACRIIGEDGKFNAGYVMADVMLNRRKNDDPETSADRPWFKTHGIFFQEHRKYQPRFVTEEIITPNLLAIPRDLGPTLVESLTKRGDERRKAFKEADMAAGAKADEKAQDKAPEPAPEEEGAMPGMGR